MVEQATIWRTMALPGCTHRLGYSGKEILKICKDRKIKLSKFWDAFGVNTVAIAEDGKPRYYQCDVERTLYQLGKKDGKFHEWD